VLVILHKNLKLNRILKFFYFIIVMNNLVDRRLNHYLNNNYTCNIDSNDTFTGVKRIIVIGDIHGDFKILIRCLKKAKVINNSLDWIGGKTHVVQLGDILDGGGRGTDFHTQPMEEFKIYEYLNNLNDRAKVYGGAVHYLIGNHELMNLAGDFRYVHKTHLINNDVRKKLFKPGGHIANMLACHSHGILKINDWLFCHAGLLPEHLANNNIKSLNNLVKKVLRGQKSIETLNNSEENLLFSKDSFFWNRFYANNEDKCTVLNKTLDILDAKKGGMVVGHTPHYNITSQCRQKLWFADVGLSGAFDNTMFNKVQVLEIKNGIPRVI